MDKPKSKANAVIKRRSHIRKTSVENSTGSMGDEVERGISNQVEPNVEVEMGKKTPGKTYETN